MSIKTKGVVTIINGRYNLRDVEESLSMLTDGEYSFFICDKKKNRTMPQLKYLFGVVLRRIADELEGERADVNDLYRFFEKKFAPIKTISINGEECIVQDLKNSTHQEMGDVIEQIVLFAERELNISMPTRDELKLPQASEAYVNAYNDQWTDYSTKV
ncbi:MAG: hypothetical protein ACRDD8_06065 [Bacteroidales bacterium]